MSPYFFLKSNDIAIIAYGGVVWRNAASRLLNQERLFVPLVTMVRIPKVKVVHMGGRPNEQVCINESCPLLIQSKVI